MKPCHYEIPLNGVAPPESISSPEGLKSGETCPALLTVGCYYQSMRDYGFLSRSFPSSALCICANGFHMARGLV